MLPRFWAKFRKKSQPESTAVSIEDVQAAEFEARVVSEFTERQKDLLRSTWNTIYCELGKVLSMVNGDKEDGMKIALKLFEEYPQSQQFFVDFKGTPLEGLTNDPKLSYALQEHAIRVSRTVEKVIGRLDNLKMVRK